MKYGGGWDDSPWCCSQRSRLQLRGNTPCHARRFGSQGATDDPKPWHTRLRLAAGVGFAMVCVLLTTDDVRTQLLSTPRAVPATKFDVALRAAMIQMDAAMCITPSGDADRDFARAMIPHHQGAIEMARVELLFGHDVRLRRLAQGIIVEQSQEIALLHSVLASEAAAFETRFIP